MAHSAGRAATHLSAGVIATVAGHPITLPAFQQSYAPEVSGAAGSVPVDPPGFGRCSAALAREYARLAGTAKREHRKLSAAPSHAALIKQCQARQQAARAGVVTQLIEQHWNQLEAQAEHITISPGAVSAALAAQRRAFGSDAAYRRYLARAGETPAQAAARIRLSLIEQQLGQRRLGAPVSVSGQQVAAYFAAHHAQFVLPGQPHPKLSTYAARIRLLLASQVRAKHSAGATLAFERRWRAQTICRPGYVVPLCANAR